MLIFFIFFFCFAFLAWVQMACWFKPAMSPLISGCGIGTGPGVIQDRYSPTMGRHRTNPLFNGHGGHMAPAPQSQFDKSFMKPTQVPADSESVVEIIIINFFKWVVTVSKGAESAFPEPNSATSSVQRHASTFQQEGTAQCWWGEMSSKRSGIICCTIMLTSWSIKYLFLLLLRQYRLAWDLLSHFSWTKPKCQSCSHRFPTWCLLALSLHAHPPLRLDRCWSSHNPPLQKASQLSFVHDWLISSSTAWPEDKSTSNSGEASEDKQETCSCQRGTAQDDCRYLITNITVYKV